MVYIIFTINLIYDIINNRVYSNYFDKILLGGFFMKEEEKELKGCNMEVKTRDKKGC